MANVDYFLGYLDAVQYVQKEAKRIPIGKLFKKVVRPISVKVPKRFGRQIEQTLKKGSFEDFVQLAEEGLGMRYFAGASAQPALIRISGLGKARIPRSQGGGMIFRSKYINNLLRVFGKNLSRKDKKIVGQIIGLHEAAELGRLGKHRVRVGISTHLSPEVLIQESNLLARYGSPGVKRTFRNMRRLMSNSVEYQAKTQAGFQALAKRAKDPEIRKMFEAVSAPSFQQNIAKIVRKAPYKSELEMLRKSGLNYGNEIVHRGTRRYKEIAKSVANKSQELSEFLLKQVTDMTGF